MKYASVGMVLFTNPRSCGGVLVRHQYERWLNRRGRPCKHSLCLVVGCTPRCVRNNDVLLVRNPRVGDTGTVITRAWTQEVCR